MALSAPVGPLAIGPPAELDCAELFTRWFVLMKNLGGPGFGLMNFWGMGYLDNPRFFIILYNTRRNPPFYHFKGRLDPSDHLTRSLPLPHPEPPWSWLPNHLNGGGATLHRLPHHRC